MKPFLDCSGGVTRRLRKKRKGLSMLNGCSFHIQQPALSFVIFLLFSSISHSTTSSLLFTCGPIHFLAFFYSFFPLVLNFSNEAVRLIFNLICLRHGAWSMGCKPRKTRAVFAMERTG